MPFAVAIFGASGSGKSSLMQLLADAGNQYSIHIKNTTRPLRTYDGVEIRSVDPFDEAQYDYVYSTYGNRYGLQRKQIDDALDAGRHHFIICNDAAVLRCIKRDYPTQFRAVFLTFDAPRMVLEQIQQQRNIKDDDISLRLAKIDGLNQTFIEEFELFDGVLVNHYGAPLASLRTQMEKLLIRFAKQADADTETLRRVLEEVLHREQRVQDDTAPPVEPNFAFILMAMSPRDPSLVDVHVSIKRACSELGIRAERVDDIEFTGQITAKVHSNIRHAEFVIADLTHERPNVYYEIGFADALGKPLILLAKIGTEVHFDLAGMRILYYDNLANLEIYLKRALAGLRHNTTS